ncbi:hypothetical protein M8C21_012554, partial [Ambrosia artemisiifolia]
VDIVNMFQNLGVGRPGGFYMPRILHGHRSRLHMMCLGRNWDPVTGYEKPCRSDGSEPPPIPFELPFLAMAAIEEAQAHLEDLPLMRPDICVANFYCIGDRLGLHQDRDESSESLAKGLPVVSISIGRPAEFCYGHTRDKKKLKKLLLDSGDVLIFGGKSRLIFHEVKKVQIDPPSMAVLRALRIQPGRLNLTLKQF